MPEANKSKVAAPVEKPEVAAPVEKAEVAAPVEKTEVESSIEIEAIPVLLLRPVQIHSGGEQISGRQVLPAELVAELIESGYAEAVEE